MIILIGNKKGGAGKTTLTMLLAWYLSSLRKMEVQVIDMDERQTISLMAAKDSILENVPLYEVTVCRPDYFPPLLRSLGRLESQVLLIDLPARIDDEHYLPVLKSAEIILCPFSYDEFTMDATLLFAIVAAKVNPGARIVFIPNRLKAGVRYELRAEADEVLRGIGPVCPGIPERIDFQRLTTLYLPEVLRPATEPLLDLLYSHYLFQDTGHPAK